MAVADDLSRTRAALQMINPAPYNAEAPPEALAGEITPTEMHYVRSNFPLPVHDGTLEVGGAVDNPLTLTLDDLHAMPAHERAVQLGAGQPTEQAIAIMMEAHWRSAVHSDRVEGIGAFNEDRDPVFQDADY